MKVNFSQVCQAVHDARQDPVYNPLDLLIHRTRERREECKWAMRRAAERELIWISKSGRVELLSEGKGYVR